MGGRSRPALVDSVLYETHQRSIWINERGETAAPGLYFGRMQPRLPFTCLRNSCIPANSVKGVQVIEPKAAAEPTGQRIEFGMREEFQGKVTPLQNHPTMISPTLYKA
jgi:hypothetical protein